jgi:hypothetical protein
MAFSEIRHLANARQSGKKERNAAGAPIASLGFNAIAAAHFPLLILLIFISRKPAYRLAQLGIGAVRHGIVMKA